MHRGSPTVIDILTEKGATALNKHPPPFPHVPTLDQLQSLAAIMIALNCLLNTKYVVL